MIELSGSTEWKIRNLQTMVDGVVISLFECSKGFVNNADSET